MRIVCFSKHSGCRDISPPREIVQGGFLFRSFQLFFIDKIIIISMIEYALICILFFLPCCMCLKYLSRKVREDVYENSNY